MLDRCKESSGAEKTRLRKSRMSIQHIGYIWEYGRTTGKLRKSVIRPSVIANQHTRPLPGLCPERTSQHQQSCRTRLYHWLTWVGNHQSKQSSDDSAMTELVSRWGHEFTSWKLSLYLLRSSWTYFSNSVIKNAVSALAWNFQFFEVISVPIHKFTNDKRTSIVWTKSDTTPVMFKSVSALLTLLIALAIKVMALWHIESQSSSTF